jgi:RNA 2',3'-cyclic 3'-phosphodiesterase
VRAFIAVAIGLAPAEGADFPSEHLTLRFLGDVPDSTPSEVDPPLRVAVEPFAPFELVVDGVGAFPSSDHPRVVWRGVTVGTEEIRSLAAAVRAAVHATGIPDDPVSFSPHVTLFRVRSPGDRVRARELLDGRRAPPARTSVWVRDVVFVESQLSPRGATHSVRARFPLGGIER